MKETGKEIVDYYLSEGFSLQEIAEFLCDGAALAAEGLTDQAAIEAAYEIVKGLSERG